MADAPPHLTSYGVIFPGNPLGESSPGILTSVLAHTCMRRQQAGDLTFKLYLQLTGHTDEPDYPRAAADVQAHRVAGLIFACHPYPFVDTPLAHRTGDTPH